MTLVIYSAYLAAASLFLMTINVIATAITIRPEGITLFRIPLPV
ncbi:MAG TPA: hypothetical protein VNX01_10210 [Bacteroidia bacterium]|nr:hypothetical protein [Bacteroidia bacterium]